MLRINEITNDDVYSVLDKDFNQTAPDFTFMHKEAGVTVYCGWINSGRKYQKEFSVGVKDGSFILNEI